jgi:hypothetical protein
MDAVAQAKTIVDPRSELPPLMYNMYHKRSTGYNSRVRIGAQMAQYFTPLHSNI